MQTMGKVEIPEDAREEAELLYLRNIVTIVEKYKNPLDQTPWKYITAMNNTMAKQSSKSVSIAGPSDKCSITGSFIGTYTTLNGHFLSMHLILWGKNKEKPP